MYVRRAKIREQKKTWFWAPQACLNCNWRRDAEAGANVGHPKAERKERSSGAAARKRSERPAERAETGLYRSARMATTCEPAELPESPHRRSGADEEAPLAPPRFSIHGTSWPYRTEGGSHRIIGPAPKTKLSCCAASRCPTSWRIFHNTGRRQLTISAAEPSAGALATWPAPKDTCLQGAQRTTDAQGPATWQRRRSFGGPTTLPPPYSPVWASFAAGYSALRKGEHRPGKGDAPLRPRRAEVTRRRNDAARARS